MRMVPAAAFGASIWPHMTKRFLRYALTPLVACACSISPRAANAQIAVGITVGPSVQPNGDSDAPRLRPGLGGTTIGGVTFLDAALGNHLSLGGEVSLGTDLKGGQIRSTSTALTGLSTRHRDTVFSGVLKVKMARALKAQIDGIVGVGASWRHTVRYGTFRSLVVPFTSAPVNETLSNAVLATTVGVDTMLNVSPRTAMLFTLRLHLLNDDDRDPSGFVRRGVESSILRFGGGALIRF